MPSLIYVVDDEKIIATTLAKILDQNGFEAIAFTDPLDALMEAESRCPDILISDVMMPQLNGVDLGVQFKAIHPSCKVLLFSGQPATDSLIKNAGRNGHRFDMLAKPIHPVDIITTINSLMADS